RQSWRPSISESESMKQRLEKPKPSSKRPQAAKGGRRERRKRWIQRGQYAVEVEVEVVYPAEDPSEGCLEPDTVRQLDEIARRAEKGDVAYLRRVGRVFQVLAQ